LQAPRARRAVPEVQISQRALCDAPMLRDELADGGHKLDGDLHRCMRRFLVRGFVLRDSVILALRVVVREDAANARLVPSGRKSFLLAHCFLLRRRRSACLAFVERSYAVMTNTDIGSGSGT